MSSCYIKLYLVESLICTTLTPSCYVKVSNEIREKFEVHSCCFVQHQLDQGLREMEEENNLCDSQPYVSRCTICATLT